MNNFILFHKGKLPKHINYCFRQIILTQKKYKIYLLTDQDITIQNVEVVNINNLDVNLKELTYYKDSNDPLWRTSFERFFYIDRFISDNKLDNVFHFDNDVLIYENVNKFLNVLENKVNDIALTPHKETELVCGFMYIKKSNSLRKLCKELLDLAKLGEIELEKKLNSMPHEMRLLGYIQNKTKNYITSLPVSPYEPGNNLYEDFKGVFDPSTYGQFFGNNRTIKDVDINRFADRYINVKVNPKFSKIPTLEVYNKNEIPIFNLHVHNKKLNEYCSNIDIDVVIPYHEKDEYTIYKCLDSLYNVKNINNIYVISKKEFVYKDVKWIDEKMFPFTKDEISNINPIIPKDRSGWYYQQLLKFYIFNVPEISNNVLLLDSDVIFLKEVSFFEQGKPCYNFSNEYTPVYFENMKKLNPYFEKSVNHSGICHHMLFQKDIMYEIFNLIKKDNEEVYETILKSINDWHNGFSEYEIYFNYIFKKYPNDVILRKLEYADVDDYKQYINSGYHYIANHAYRRI